MGPPYALLRELALVERERDRLHRDLARVGVQLRRDVARRPRPVEDPLLDRGLVVVAAAELDGDVLLLDLAAAPALLREALLDPLPDLGLVVDPALEGD